MVVVCVDHQVFGVRQCHVTICTMLCEDMMVSCGSMYSVM